LFDRDYCVSIKGFLSFTARWKLIGVSRDIEFDIRNDLLKRLLLLEPEFTCAIAPAIDVARN